MDYWSAPRRAKIPRLGFGTWQIKGEECVSSVLQALEAGYRHIDTAQIYDNEAEVGKAVESSKIPRDEIFLTTKVWKDFLDFREILINVSKSLERLKVDYVDLLLIHWPNPQYPLEETLEAFKELVDTKKIRAAGLSNFNVKLMKKARKLFPSLICNQVEYHPFLSQKKVLKEVRKNKMFLTAYSPLARGLASKNPTLRAIGKKYGKTPAQAALRWLMDQEDIVVIPKSKNKKHIRDNFEIFDFKLEPDDYEQISRLQAKNKRTVNPEWAPKWDS